MTVCLGVLCPHDGAVVVAADRMVSGGPTQVEFEHEGAKIEVLTSSCVALTAGDALVGRPLFRDVRAQLRDEPPGTVKEVVDVVVNTFVEHRLATAEDLYLRGRGVTIQQFYDQYINAWPDPLAQGIDEQIQKTELRTQLLVAGVDSEPHLYIVHDPGTSVCMDSLEFGAIGSGTALATLQWITRCSGPAGSVSEAIFVAHEAKLKSEAHPGVGVRTDMAIVYRNRCIRLSDDQFEWLRKLQQTQDTRELPQLDEMQEWLEEIHERSDDEQEGDEI